VSWEANIRARGRHVISKQQEGAFYILRSGGPSPHGTQIPSRKPHPKPTPNPHPKSPKQRTISHPLDGPKQPRISMIFSSKKTKEKDKLIEEKKIINISPNRPERQDETEARQ